MGLRNSGQGGWHQRRRHHLGTRHPAPATQDSTRRRRRSRSGRHPRRTCPPWCSTGMSPWTAARPTSTDARSASYWLMVRTRIWPSYGPGWRGGIGSTPRSRRRRSGRPTRRQRLRRGLAGWGRGPMLIRCHRGSGGGGDRISAANLKGPLSDPCSKLKSIFSAPTTAKQRERTVK
jgi:hypothetical protein